MFLSTGALRRACSLGDIFLPPLYSGCFVPVAKKRIVPEKFCVAGYAIGGTIAGSGSRVRIDRCGRIRILLNKNRMPRLRRPARAGKKRLDWRDLGSPSGPDPARTRSQAAQSVVLPPIGRRPGPLWPLSLPRPRSTPEIEPAPAELGGGPPDVAVRWDTVGHSWPCPPSIPFQFLR